MVNRTARINGLAAGGEITLSEEVKNELIDVVGAGVSIKSRGHYALNGVKGDVGVFSMLPLKLSHRRAAYMYVPCMQRNEPKLPQNE